MYKSSLPQGAPTSPMLSNMVFKPIDDAIYAYCLARKILYTRYADDITFSGSYDLINSKLLEYVTTIIEDCGFEINNKKTRFAGKGKKQEVTGLIVNNDTINVPKRYIKEIRQELYYINKFGIKEHRAKVGFENKYYKEHLLGKILYVKSVNNEKGLKLLEYYNDIKW